MKTDYAITQERFEELLAWLDSNRDRAGHKYEEIRRSLVRIFAWRKCTNAEELADATINIVAQKAAKLRTTYEGDPDHYFFAVARNLIKEYQKDKTIMVGLEEAETPAHSVLDNTDDELEHVDVCLRKCLERLEPTERELVLAYYQKDGQAKIELRKQLAQDRGIDPNAMRVKMYRLRDSLGQCIEKCLETISTK